ncbi:MAG: 5 nucleotidase, deoxy, cytosolic type [Ferruginibacter sp.]|nr:5 nucleotidase, deoxy, cytosolic type [Ferruginibacter sp.]
MKSIAIDMDGVLANVYSQFVRMHAEEYGKIITAEEMSGRPEGDVFPDALKFVNSPGFFRTAPLIKDCQKILEQLNLRYSVFIVSAALEFPNSLIEKQSWLNEHFQFINWKQIVFCGSKEIIKADIMIDDHFKNLDFFTGETILFTQPHNELTDPGIHKRVNSWKEIGELFLR